MLSDRSHNTQGRGRHLFTFTIASTDMRYIERAERQIVLSQDAANQMILRGEMPDCGPDCYIDLAQIALEYALSCEGCGGTEEWEDYIDHFGKRLGKALPQKLQETESADDKPIQLVKVMECILRSTGVAFETHREGKQLVFDLDQCPISQAAKHYGVNRGKEMARRALITVCESAASSVLPGSKLIEPSDRTSDGPLRRIVVALS